MNQTFRASGINYGEAVECLDGELVKTKATEEERLTAHLLFEECFTRMEGPAPTRRLFPSSFGFGNVGAASVSVFPRKGIPSIRWKR